ncbi:MAG: recombinase family protein [Chloroflexi bacterium]|nr:recombinase family protein [Chloroflexota bacterium]
MRAVGYIRVSSEMQIETGHSLDAQRTLITDFVRAKGWSLGEIFCDAGLSGTLSARPALQTLMARSEQHDFDVVIVHAIDRFYRDLSGLLAALHHLHQHQVTFISITENLDFTTPWGKLVLAVLGTLAEIFIDKLRAETIRGKQARARKGFWNGSIPLGYCNGLCSHCTDVNGKDYCPNFGHPDCSSRNHLIAHPIESHAVRLAYEWYEQGIFSDASLAAKLNAYELHLPDGSLCHFRSKRWVSRGGPQPLHRDTVREILSRPFYTGQLPDYGKTARGKRLKRNAVTFWAQGVHPALVSRESYERCQWVRQLLGNRPRSSALRTRRNYPLSGFLYCSQCGRRMVGLFRHAERRYYCTTPLGHDGDLCHQPSINAEEIENQVVAFFSQFHWPEDWRKQYRVRVKRGKRLSAEEELKLRELGQIAHFAANWHGARNMIEQKRLLQTAIVRLTLQERELIEIQTSVDLSRVILGLGWAKEDDRGINPGYRLRNLKTQVRIKLSSPKLESQ